MNVGIKYHPNGKWVRANQSFPFEWEGRSLIARFGSLYVEDHIYTLVNRGGRLRAYCPYHQTWYGLNGGWFEPVEGVEIDLEELV